MEVKPKPSNESNINEMANRDAIRVLLVDDHAVAAARLARVARPAAVAAADIADHVAHELAERRARDGLELAGALAALARLDRRAGLGAVAVAGGAARARVV